MVLVRQPFNDPPKMRDEQADALRAVKEAIATYRDVGREPPEHLQHLLEEAETADQPAQLEHAAAETLPEAAVPAPPRKPGRPRKFDDSAAGS